MAKNINRLNQTFSLDYLNKIISPYVLSIDLATSIVAGNSNINSGVELRLDDIYCEELWLKLNRLGVGKDSFLDSHVLEVCSGSGFLAFHLLNRTAFNSLTLNDVSANELDAAKNLLNSAHPNQSINYILGDMHVLNLEEKFDIIIGNSFLHHFYDVPKVLQSIEAMLKPDGIFISLHEPTRMSLVVESGKWYLWPFAIFFPQFILELARFFYKGIRGDVDVWLFDTSELAALGVNAGFLKVKQIPWGLLRPLIVRIFNINLDANYKTLTSTHNFLLKTAIHFDSKLNKLLSPKCFGSTSVLFSK